MKDFDARDATRPGTELLGAIREFDQQLDGLLPELEIAEEACEEVVLHGICPDDGV